MSDLGSVSATHGDHGRKLSPTEAAEKAKRLEMVRLNTPGAASPAELEKYRNPG
jgi:hypothetical protein